MGLLDSIGGLVGGGGGGLIGDLLGGGAGGVVGDLLGGGIGGEALKIGEGLIGQFAGGGAAGPAGDLFSVLKGVAGDLLGNIGNFGGAGQAPAAGGTPPTGGTAPTDGTGSTDGTSGGGSIYDKLFALLAKLQDKLNQKVDQASQIDPSNQAGLQKAMFEVQQIQSQMTELVTTATNLLKTQHDTQMSEVRNFA
jgi:hypothetical protein